ncbi:MAG TPA: N-acetylmuramic acid 6-phosphate etherase [Thermoanaerobaculia bacterium]|nr:N-acetylmuramic acid 6-phosphate etherase [Thermoanaerobaculia bacterium]
MSGTLAFLRRLSDADRDVPERVAAALPDIARAVDAIAARLDGGGRWFYTGAGTSGRLGALDAAEIPPTFGTDPSLVVALMAGGRRALLESAEGAEDDEGAGARDLETAGLTPRDAVVGIAASGATPYVRGAVRSAREKGALTVAVVCRPAAPLLSEAEIPILVDVGEEVLHDSSRLRAGTAQKLVLNMLSTAVMAKRGLVYRDEMVAMKPTNEKLKRRAVRILEELAGIKGERAEDLLKRCEWRLPTALISAKWGLSAEAAADHLSKKKNNVAVALSQPPGTDET